MMNSLNFKIKLTYNKLNRDHNKEVIYIKRNYCLKYLLKSKILIVKVDLLLMQIEMLRYLENKLENWMKNN